MAVSDADVIWMERLDEIVPFCPQCKSLAYPKDGQLSCRKCGWSGGTSGGQMINSSRPNESPGRKRVILEDKVEARPEQSITCTKCGNGRAYFHLMQTRRSDEPPTQINECTKCGHSWREY